MSFILGMILIGIMFFILTVVSIGFTVLFHKKNKKSWIFFLTLSVVFFMTLYVFTAIVLTGASVYFVNSLG